MKGYKKTNQDRCTAFSYLEADPELAFFAVYDGHGGTGVANYLKDHLHEFILSQEACFSNSQNLQLDLFGFDPKVSKNVFRYTHFLGSHQFSIHKLSQILHFKA